jgi:hypothetical protein
MQDGLVQRVVTFLAGALAGGLAVWALNDGAAADRYAIAAAGRTIAVLDTRTGQVQTFERSGEAGILTYRGVDSRRLHLARRERAEP